MRRKLRGSLFPTSALGQKRTFGYVRVMSALPPKADIRAIRSAFRAEAIQEVGFTRKLKPYFSKTDFAVCVRKNDKYCTASDLAFAVNATG